MHIRTNVMMMGQACAGAHLQFCLQSKVINEHLSVRVFRSPRVAEETGV